MRQRARRRGLVVWSSSVGSADRYGALGLTPPARNRRIRRFIRTSALLTAMGLIGLARGVRPCWQLVLAGGALTVIGTMLRGPGGMLLLPGLLFLLSAPLILALREEDREERLELARELAAYSTPAQRRDLEATLDQYADGDTHELRDILTSQAMAASGSGIPGAGRH